MTTATHAKLEKRGDAGYSMVGVLVALVLLAVGILALANAGTQTVAMENQMATRTTALEIARTYMEQVRSQEPDELTSHSPEPVNGQGEPDEDGVFRRALVVEDTEDVNMKKVTVRVYAPNLDSPIELVTLAYGGSL